MLNKYQDKYFGTQWFPETVIFERHAKKYLHTINWNSNSPDKPGLLLQGLPDKLGDYVKFQFDAKLDKAGNKLDPRHEFLETISYSHTGNILGNELLSRIFFIGKWEFMKKVLSARASSRRRQIGCAVFVVVDAVIEWVVTVLQVLFPFFVLGALVMGPMCYSAQPEP